MKSGIPALIFVVIVLSCKNEEANLSSFDLIQNQIFNTNCAIPACHQSKNDASFTQHGLILEKSVAWENLVNRAPKNLNAIQDELLLVKPNHPDKSLLLHKVHLADHHESDYGNLMPLGLNALSEGQVEFIRQWIEAGAPQKGSVADEQLLEDTTPQEEAFEPLPIPEPGQGLQVTIPQFEVAPDFERELFVYKKLGNTEPIYVNRIEIKMRNNSHHFIMYDFSSQLPSLLKPELNVIRDIRNPDGSMNLKNMLPMSYHVYMAGAQTAYSNYRFPDGVGIFIPAQAAVDLNSHYVNKLSSPIKGEVNLNLYTTNNVQRVAKPLNLGNRLIYLPPQKRTTMVENFIMDKPVKIFLLTSHTHQLGEKFVIKIKGGPRNGEVVYTSTDWHHPEVISFPTPITLKAGEGLTSEITYFNTKDTPVYFGLSSEDEMGIIFGYYYEE